MLAFPSGSRKPVIIDIWLCQTVMKCSRQEAVWAVGPRSDCPFCARVLERSSDLLYRLPRISQPQDASKVKFILWRHYWVGFKLDGMLWRASVLEAKGGRRSRDIFFLCGLAGLENGRTLVRSVIHAPEWKPRKKSTLGNHWLSFLWSLRRLAIHFDDDDDDHRHDNERDEM